MFNVIVEKECGCFKKSSLSANSQFATKEEAQKEAEAMCEDMNDTFCQKHIFTLEENGNDIIIKMAMRD